jgi:nucleoid-associated protein EbfC
MPKPKKPGAAMGDIVRHAASVQNKVDKVRDKLRDHEVTADTAGGKVSVTVTCSGHLRQIHVDPALFEAEGLEMTLDLVVTAANKALDEADQLVDEEVTKAAGGLRIPGINA